MICTQGLGKNDTAFGNWLQALETPPSHGLEEQKYLESVHELAHLHQGCVRCSGAALGGAVLRLEAGVVVSATNREACDLRPREV